MENLGPRPARSPWREPLTGPRRAVLDLLLDADDPVTVPQAALELGQHRNTVRDHLEALVRMGLATREPGTPQGRGRPATAYRATAAAAVGGTEYAVLAEVLVEHVAATWPAGEERRTQALLAGRRWGRSLLERGLAGRGPDGDVDLAATFHAAGFDPVAEPAAGRIHLRRCPVLALARRHPDVVCAAHLGMARELAGDGVDLVPFAEPGACILTAVP